MKEQELFQVPLPERTRSYSPVAHQQIVEEIRGQIGNTGLQIEDTRYQVAQEGQQMIGYMDISAKTSGVFNYRLAFQNSYNKTMPVAFVGGTSVMICSNGMIVGDTKFIRRHTGTVGQELSEKIHQVVEELQQDLSTAEQHAEQMKLVQLNPTATAELCGRLLMEHEIITSSQLSIIRQEYKKPTYPELAGDTLWNLYNHTTHALKKTHPYNYLDSHSRLHKFVETEFELV